MLNLSAVSCLPPSPVSGLTTMGNLKHFRVESLCPAQPNERERRPGDFRQIFMRIVASSPVSAENVMSDQFLS